MPSLSSVHFDLSGWEPVERHETIAVWGDDVKMLRAVLSLEYFRMKPEFAFPLSDIRSVRFIFRTMANQAGGGMISADVIDVSGIPAVKAVFKMPQPTQGMQYLGSINVPFADFSYVIKVQCAEKGITGVREALIVDKLLAEGSKVDPATGMIEGFESDPYDREGKYLHTPNKAEDESLDADFPDHALSRCRRFLGAIERSLTFDAEVLNAEPFTP